MKKILASLILLSSCANESSITLDSKESTKDSTVVVESLEDSVTQRVEDLLDSTQGVEKKVNEIKTIKQENLVLKKELYETKQELSTVKAQLADTTADESLPTKKKKNFIQKVVSTIKKDTAQ